MSQVLQGVKASGWLCGFLASSSYGCVAQLAPSLALPAWLPTVVFPEIYWGSPHSSLIGSWINHLLSSPPLLRKHFYHSLPFQYLPGFSLFSHTEDEVNLISSIFITSSINFWRKLINIQYQKCSKYCNEARGTKCILSSCHFL